MLSRKGQLLPFWVPTWQNDFELVNPLSSADTIVDCKSSGAAPTAPFVIMMQKNDGSLTFRRVSSALKFDETTLRLTLTDDVGFDSDISQMKKISLMRVYRHASDLTTFKHQGRGDNLITEISMPITTV